MKVRTKIIISPETEEERNMLTSKTIATSFRMEEDLANYQRTLKDTLGGFIYRWFGDVPIKGKQDQYIELDVNDQSWEDWE